MSLQVIRQRFTTMEYRGKRLFDVIGAIAALMLCSPLMLLVALVVAIRMGRPILFKQERPGYGERPFSIYKFRTMRICENEADTQVCDQSRITSLGRFLRETSLDELPNLFNVVKGEMSLVGPRPLLKEHGVYLTKRDRLRFAIRPGVTGWSQVNGRNGVSWEQRVEHDVWYVEHCSFMLDVKVLFLTIFVVLNRSNVYSDTADVRRLRQSPCPQEASPATNSSGP